MRLITWTTVQITQAYKQQKKKKRRNRVCDFTRGLSENGCDIPAQWQHEKLPETMADLAKTPLPRGPHQPGGSQLTAAGEAALGRDGKAEGHSAYSWKGQGKQELPKTQTLA